MCSLPGMGVGEGWVQVHRWFQGGCGERFLGVFYWAKGSGPQTTPRSPHHIDLNVQRSQNALKDSRSLPFMEKGLLGRRAGVGGHLCVA